VDIAENGAERAKKIVSGAESETFEERGAGAERGAGDRGTGAER
jgi:hypothetical protein